MQITLRKNTEILCIEEKMYLYALVYFNSFQMWGVPK